VAEQTETAVLVMSDLHYGKRTPTFNPEVFVARLDKLAQRLVRIRELLATYSFDELVVCVLGDANDGTDIYPTQAHHQAITDVQLQAHDLAEHLAAFLESQLPIWGSVRVEAVPGNHGRSGHRAAEAASWDLVCYNYLALRLRGKIDVHSSRESDPFLRKIKIRGHDVLLTHGHDIITYANIPWYGMMLRCMRWSTGELAPIDVVLMGHFHSFGHWRINRLHLFLTGTMITDDEWSRRRFGWEPATAWWLFGVSDKYPVTWQFAMRLDDA
jgi:DNA polymerase II small subunit/DNA polymerase delta subunit B